METEIDEKITICPRSSQFSRPGSASLKPGPKVNPFGNAKPREVILQEKGRDWRKIDLDKEHRRIDRLETMKRGCWKKRLTYLRWT